MQSSSSSSLFIHIPTLTNTSTATTTPTPTTTTTTPNKSKTSNTTANSQNNLLSTNSIIDQSNELNQQLYNKLNSIQPTVIFLSSNSLSSTVTSSTTTTALNTATQLDLTKFIPLAATPSANPNSQIKQLAIGNSSSFSNSLINQRRKERPIQPKRVVTIAPNLVVPSNQNVKPTQPQTSTNKTPENFLSTLINTQQLVENTPNQNSSSRKSPQKRKSSSTSQTKGVKKQLKEKSIDFNNNNNNNNNSNLNESNLLNGSIQTQRKRRQKRTKTQENEEEDSKKPSQVSENECVLKSNLNPQKNTKPRVKNKNKLETNSTTAVKATRRTRTLCSTKSTSLTQFSQTIFDSIEYLSSSWIEIFEKGNENNPEHLNTFRHFHCADCLKSFQEQREKDKNLQIQTYISNNRSQMNTPPPALQPLAGDALNGLYHYFGQPPATTTTTYQFAAMFNNTTSQKAMPSYSSAMRTQTEAQILNDQFKINEEFLQTTNPGNTSDLNQSNQINVTFSSMNTNGQQQNTNANYQISSEKLSTSSLSDEYSTDSKFELTQDDFSQISLQEKRQFLNRKLQTRRPKQDLVERGILPPPRVPLLHYDQMKHLEKAQVHDILEKKLGKRPNRELLVQKNILLDSKAAPSLQLKCKEFKRARLADDLNVRISNRPGPLELVESGILISSDSSLTQAIKDGRIIYPRTTSAASKVHHPNQALILHQFDTNNFDDLASLNFNFNNQTDTEDSNASQQSNSTTKTINTINSVNSFNFGEVLSANAQQNKQQSNVNFADLFSQSSASSSPASNNPVDSTLLNNQVPSPSVIGNEILKPKTNKKSLKSSSSTTSSIASFKSNKSSSNSSNKKTLIFHEYKGPNQKVSKSSMRFASNKSSQKLSRNNSITNSNANYSNMNSNMNNSDLINCLIEDSSDSAQSPLFDSNNELSELNSYKIRLEQQKMFLQYNNQNSPISSSSSSMNENHLNNANSTSIAVNSSTTSSKNTGNFMSHDGQMIMNEIKNIQHATNQISASTAQTPSHIMSNCANNSLNGNNAQTPIILPINDIKSLDSLRTLGFIKTISISEPSANSIENEQTTISLINQSANIYSIETANSCLTQIGQLLSTANSLPNNSAVGSFTAPLNVEMSENCNKETNSNSLKALSSTVINEQSTQKHVNFESMTLNELREECVRNGLTKQGNKQILIERLRLNREKQQQKQQQLTLAPNTNQTLINQQRSFIKSPDSGVNMDEPSPCSSINSITNVSNATSLNKINTNIQQTSATTPVNNLNSATNNNSIYYDFDASNLINCSTSSSLSSSSSSSTTKLINNKVPSEHQRDEYKQIEDIRNQLKLDTFRTSTGLLHQPSQPQSVNTLNNGSEFEVNEPNLEETAAYLEMSWKNTAKLIKELSSSSAKIEQIQQVEQHVQESMQYIERLKLACKTKPTNSFNLISNNDTPSVNYLLSNINSSSNVLANNNSNNNSASSTNANIRLINSEPCNLKDIVSYSHSVDNSNNENYQTFQSINNSNNNPELIKNHHINGNNQGNIPSFSTNKNPFETNFDSIDQQQRTQNSVTFFVDQSNQFYESEQQTFNKNQNELSSAASDQQQSNTNQILEMDWNDTDFLQLFNEIDALNST